MRSADWRWSNEIHLFGLAPRPSWSFEGLAPLSSGLATTRTQQISNPDLTPA